MAIKIRCSECEKRISIDEAFAGGACRCPYCKAIVMVPAEGTAPSSRPAEPRPDAPDSEMVSSAVLVPENVPMARPVRVQSYVALGLIAALGLLMIVGAVFFILSLRGDEKKVEVETTFVEGPNPFAAPSVEGPSVANDVPVTAPVVYIIDCGNTMVRMIDMAAAITRLSIRSLDGNQQFTVILSLSEALSMSSDTAANNAPSKLPAEVMMLNNGLTGGGKSGERLAKRFIEDAQDTGRLGKGRADVAPALKAALDLNPKTIVLFTRKDLEGADSLIEAAHKAGVKIVPLALDADASIYDSLTKVAKATDSQSRAYSFVKLNDWSADFFKQDE